MDALVFRAVEYTSELHTSTQRIARILELGYFKKAFSVQSSGTSDVFDVPYVSASDGTHRTGTRLILILLLLVGIRIVLGGL